MAGTQTVLMRAYRILDGSYFYWRAGKYDPAMDEAVGSQTPPFPKGEYADQMVSGHVSDQANPAPTKLVFRPGGIASGFVYTDWALLMTDLALIEGFKEIVIDDSLGAPTIPAGTWDLRATALTDGRLTTAVGDGLSRVFVTLTAGTQILNCPSLSNLSIKSPSSTATVPFLYDTKDAPPSVTCYNCHFSPGKTAPPAVFLVTGTAALNMVLHDTQLQASPTQVVVQAAGSSELSFVLLGNSSVSDAALADDGTCSLLRVDRVASGAMSQKASDHPGWTGGFSTVINTYDDARYLEYDDSGSGIGADKVQKAIEVVASMAAIAPKTFVFWPGGVAKGNTYTDWNLLYTDLSAENGRCEVYINDYAATPVIPAGMYDFRDRVVLKGSPGWGGAASDGRATLQFADGARILDCYRIEDLRLEGSATGVNGHFTYSSVIGVHEQYQVDLIRCTTWNPTGPGIFEVVYCDPLYVCWDTELNGRSFLGVNNAVLKFSLRGKSKLAGSSLLGDGTCSVTDVEAEATSTAIITPGGQPGWAGSLPAAVTLADHADYESYTPAILGDWSGVAPKSVADALDRIAAVLTPIP